MKILVTGFEPFGSHRSNPSWDAVEALPEEIEGVQIVKRKLPVSFRRFSAPLEAAIEEERPDGLICVGLAGGEDKVSVERVGINLMEARIPDNDGFQPFDTPIRPDGDTAYFSTLPVKRMAKAVESRGIACCVSYSAGTFVCNAALYTGLYLSSRRYRFMKCCFIHVPYDETMEEALAGQPFMKRETLTEALIAAAGEAARALKAGKESGDLQEAAGTIF
ncbi:MAG: pyroglutamyl-peptidase I [Clostridium sp.]|nr:pyroglutamyl-peptidase I [Clostridium sp.]